MTNKTLFFSILFIIAFNSFSQNIEFKKVIDDNVRIKEYDFGGHDAFIRYQKVADNMVLRFEDLKLQLYTVDFERLWEINFERLTGGTKGYNKFSTAFDADFIYIMQYNITIYRPGGGSVKSILYKIDYDGNIVKSINFHDLEKIESVRKMELIDGELFVIWSKSPIAEKQTVRGTGFDIYNQVTHLNSNLVQIGKSLKLPFKIKDTKHSAYWGYEGIVDGNFVFRRFYSRNNKGVYTTYVSYDNTEYYEYIEVTKGLELENYRAGNTADNGEYSEYLNSNIKYDTNLYKLEFNGVEHKIGNLIHSYPLDQTAPTSELFLYKRGKKSENLIDAMYRLVDTKLEHKTRLSISRIIADPINNSVNIIAQFSSYYPPTYMFTLNKDLKVISIIEYSEGTKLGGRYEFGHPYSYNYGCYSYKKIWGDINSNHKINALEYSAEIGVKSHVTILNYDTYQIMILDSKRKNTCTVYKIVR